MLRIEGLRKAFSGPAGPVPVVDIAAFALGAGEQRALRGRSGSGKTTFLNLIAGIQRADAGRILFDDVEVSALGEPERDRLRAQKLGYIFQSFNLLQGFTVLENVMLGMAFGGGRVDRNRARHLLARVGLGERADYWPRQLSTGQQQRAAVARALANAPRLVLADEPTGNLDAVHRDETLQLIRDVCREQQAALLLVSHDDAVLGRFEGVTDFAALNRPSV